MKAAPVEYVKVCPTYGPGYFYLPGSDTCVKVTPRVTFDQLFATPVTRAGAVTQPRTRAYIQADARQMTEYGLVRVYTSLYGEFIGSKAQNEGLTRVSAKNTVQADAAFVQFGGLTAGRYDPQIEEAYGYNYSQAGAYAVRNPVTDGPTNGFMYAASLGNGITALVSLEDQTASRNSAANAATDGGVGTPDVIGKVKIDQSWGSAFVAAGSHEVRGQVAAAVNGATGGDAGYGYAVKAGLKINLPMLAAGDNIGGQIGYSEGFNAATLNGYNVANSNLAVGGWTVTAPDAINDDKNKLTKVWSAGVGIQHYWTPTVYSTLFGHYANVDQFGAANNFALYSIGSMLAWTPVKGMVISGEAAYSKINLNNALKAGMPVSGAATPINGVTVTRTSDRQDQWSGRIRVSRSF
jgi:Porin subfamily